MKILDHLNLCYIWVRTYLREHLRWTAKKCSNASDVRVFYGYETLAGTDQQVFGGLVKLQDLQPYFPNRINTPNVLYLVSSALPYFPVRMAGMAKKAGAKLVINQNGVAYPGWYGDGWEKQNQPMKELHSLADYIFYQSKFCKNSADEFLGSRDSGYEILYNPVDTSYFCPEQKAVSDAQVYTGNRDDTVTLLLAGSHWSSYRPLVAVDVLQLLTETGKYNVVLKIAGRFCWTADPAAGEKQVLDYAVECGVADKLLISGSYSQNEAVTVLRSSSILLHTKYNDPCPRLVVEAMSCGLPIVYSATGGVPELVGRNAGIGVTGPLSWQKDYPPHAEDLAVAVEGVLGDFVAFSRAARSRAVDKFDVRPWIKRHKEIFSELL